MTLQELLNLLTELESLKPTHYKKVSKLLAQEATTHNAQEAKNLVHELRSCKS